jgi:hypothetical protein
MVGRAPRAHRPFGGRCARLYVDRGRRPDGLCSESVDLFEIFGTASVSETGATHVKIAGRALPSRDREGACAVSYSQLSQCCPAMFFHSDG